jgi:hypothetical protein
MGHNHYGQNLGIKELKVAIEAYPESCHSADQTASATIMAHISFCAQGQMSQRFLWKTSLPSSYSLRPSAHQNQS